MTVSLHADPVDMVAYVRGSLSKARANDVRKHCFACRDCGDQLAAVMLLRGATPVRASGPWYASRSAAAAAALVLLAGAVAWFAWGGSSARPQELIDSGTAAGVSDPSARPLPGSPEFAMLTESDVQIINGIAQYERQLDGLGAATGSDSESANTLSALRAGVDALSAGNYGVAAGYLDRFGDSYHPTGTYLLGLALFFEGRRRPDAWQALESHLSTLDDPGRVDWRTSDRATAYYLARLHLEAGELDAARQLLRQAALPPASDPGWVADLDQVQRNVRQLLLDLK